MANKLGYVNTAARYQIPLTNC